MQSTDHIIHTKVKNMNPCPDKPNCVSSLDRDRKHFIEPLHFSDSLMDARGRLLNTISEIKRVRVVSSQENFIKAEFTSFLFRFVDDAEFLFDDQNKIIHLKSASRVGYSDLGANRRRLEYIRKRLNQREKRITNR